MSLPPEPTPPSQSALLVLDARGIVRAANTAAGSLWQTPAADLAGQPVVSLFAFEIHSDDPSWRESQWEVLVATSTNRPLKLQAQPFEPLPAIDVTIELQTAHGPDKVYFARIDRVPTTPPELTSPPNPKATANPFVHPLTKPVESPTTTAPTVRDLLAAFGPVGLLDLDLKCGIIVTSPAWHKILGYTKSELPTTLTAWRELIHPDDSAAWPDRAGKQTSIHTRDFSVELRLRHRQGHYVWIQSTGIQIFGPDQALQRVISVNVDITERKEAEELGLASDERLSRISEEGRLALFDLNFTTSTHWFSPACIQLLGETPSTESLLAILPTAAAKQGLPAYFAAIAPPSHYIAQPIAIKSIDGQETPAILGLHRQYSRKNELTHVTGYILPLPAGAGSSPIPTNLIGSVLDTLSEAIIVTDTRSQVLYLNAKAARLTGHAIEQARELTLKEVFQLVRTEDGRPDLSALDLALATEETPRLHAHHSLSAHNGSQPIPIVWTSRQATNADGSTAGIIVVFRDPQEMTLTPQEVLRANRFDTLGQLAGGIAHDFNNLLTTILGGISTAKDNRDYTKLEDAESACLTAKLLTRQLLNFAKGSESTRLQVIPTGDLLQDAIRIAAAGTTAVVTVDSANDIPPIQVDRGQMLQVFQNLVINALQAMPEPSKGKVLLRAREVTLAENEVPPLPIGQYIQIEVQDNGCGIPPESIEKIFEPFYTTKKQGTGLGLSTVLSIIRQHGGQIGVDSVVGTGTTFTLFLPAAKRSTETVARTPATLRFGTGRILFLDDDPKICELTAGMLTSLDYTYDTVRTGEDAITYYRRYLNVGRPYDAVILDLNVIGGMGGEECFRKLLELHPEVRAIVNSGYDSEEIARRYLDMGFVGYLTKPYRVSDLGRAIKSALGK